ncbi:hypothetical protein GW17_00003417 [Ensete ventricosum]|nr:hypothetical protein GW17_00003417 [Ensete ventricosum]RZS00454.1 hypothetical protein BHM03_00030163 [Ensete ventricosum]
MAGMVQDQERDERAEEKKKRRWRREGEEAEKKGREAGGDRQGRENFRAGQQTGNGGSYKQWAARGRRVKS